MKIEKLFKPVNLDKPSVEHPCVKKSGTGQDILSDFIHMFGGYLEITIHIIKFLDTETRNI